MSWLKHYRQSLEDGSSAHVVRKARSVAWGFTALWIVGLIWLLKAPHAGGTGTSIFVMYVGLLLAALLIYSIVQLLFLPTRR